MFLSHKQALNFPKGVFAGTVIPPEALVQTLSVSELPAKPTAEPTEEKPRGETLTERLTDLVLLMVFNCY